MQRNIQPRWKQTFGFPEAITAKSTKSKRRNRKISEKKAKKKTRATGRNQFHTWAQRSSKCKAIDVICNFCWKANHFKQTCFKKSNKTSKTSESCELWDKPKVRLWRNEQWQWNMSVCVQHKNSKSKDKKNRQGFKHITTYQLIHW